MIACSYSVISGCNSVSPNEYFDEAVLNCNLMNGFSNDGLLRELESPSFRLVAGTNTSTVMKRKEVIDNKIKYLEDNLAKIQQLPETADTRDLLHASISLYNYVLPVYKNEYHQLADLYDYSASNAEIETFARQIHDRHYSRFEELFNKLVSIGKPYAAKHHIIVNWDSF